MAPTIDQLNATIQDLTNDIQAMKVCLENVKAIALSAFNDDYEVSNIDNYVGYKVNDDFIGDFDYDDHNIVDNDYNTDVDDDDFDDDCDYYFDDYYDDDDEDDYDDDDNYEDFPFLELDPPPENNLAKALHYMPTGN